MINNLRLKKFIQKAMTGAHSLAMNKRTIEDKTFTGFEGSDQPVEKRVEELIGKMTFEEKIDFVGGYKSLGIRAIPRLGLPSVWCSDATSGVRSYGEATAFPANIALTASWNRELIGKVGDAIAEELRAKGGSVLLAPGINIYRVPTCGRNFEYMGEDPYLAGEMVVPYIQAVQNRKVITTVKHFACNNSDYDRHRTDSIVDQRALREIYFPAFKKAVQIGKSAGVMTSYNPVNGVYASEHKELITDILRGEWGFDGFVVSDWNSLYSTVGPIKAGLDLEMPSGKWINKKTVMKAVEEKKLTEEDITQMVRRVLTVFFQFGIYDRKPEDESCQVGSPEHKAVALQAAREGAVLLKNRENLLPLNVGDLKKIAVVGPLAVNTPVGGGGSSLLGVTTGTVDLFTGIKDRAGSGIQVDFVKSDRGKLKGLEAATVREADVVILCVGYTNVEESECYDKMWNLPYGQDQLIRRAAELNPKTVVVLTSGTGCETESWIRSAGALLQSFYLGQAVGTAVAEILFGDVNPSGRLPFTIAKKWEDIAATKNYVKSPDKTSPRQIDGERSKDPAKRTLTRMHYEEGLMIGYRHFCTDGIDPQYPFGFGLSYTQFEYSGLKVTTGSLSDEFPLEISFSVKNAGNRDGFEVVQAYLHDPVSLLPRPLRELKAFEKVFLKAGEKKTVKMSFDPSAFRYYDPEKKKWVAEGGEFVVQIGRNVRDIELEESCTLK